MRNDENRPIDNPDNRNEELSWNDPKHPRYGEHKDKLSYDPKLGYQEPANSPSIAEDANTGDHTPIRTNPAGESIDNDPVHQSQGKELDDYEILKEGPDSTVPGSDRTLSDSILDGPETGGSQETKEEESERAFNEQAREVELDTATYPSAQAANDTNVVKKASPEGPLHLEEEQEAREGGFAEDPQGLNHTGVDYGVQESDYGDEEEPTVNLHQELADAEKRLRHEE